MILNKFLVASERSASCRNITQTPVDHGFNRTSETHKLSNNLTRGKSKSEESVRTWTEFSNLVSDVFGSPFADLVIVVEYDEFHGETTCKLTQVFVVSVASLYDPALCRL